MNAKEVWKSKWVRRESIGKGGQGLTYFATPIGEGDEKNLYVIKFLKEQKNTERRERMFVEISALRILEHPNIPLLIDHNANSYKNTDIEMYLVSEYIKGQTLQKFIDNNTLDLNNSLALCLSLADTIEFCHQKGFVHRDIKPDNIILKNDKINEPVLIDFGLSFNEEVSLLKGDTPSWQHIGNRFLSLPELRVSEAYKRDPRSDVTMLCGILLFCLTGIHPTDLLDANNTKPHRRKLAKEKLSLIDKNRLSSLNNIFDIGFNLGINDRWQSIQSLKDAFVDLKNLQEEKQKGMDLRSRLDKFKERIERRVDYQQLQNLQGIVDNYYRTLENSLSAALERLDSNQFGSTLYGVTPDYTISAFEFKLGISHKFNKYLSFIPTFVMYLNGSEFVIEATENSKRTELHRYPANENFDWGHMQAKAENYLLEGIIGKEE